MDRSGDESDGNTPYQPGVEKPTVPALLPAATFMEKGRAGVRGFLSVMDKTASLRGAQGLVVALLSTVPN